MLTCTVLPRTRADGDNLLGIFSSCRTCESVGHLLQLGSELFACLFHPGHYFENESIPLVATKHD